MGLSLVVSFQGNDITLVAYLPDLRPREHKSSEVVFREVRGCHVPCAPPTLTLASGDMARLLPESPTHLQWGSRVDVWPFCSPNSCLWLLGGGRPMAKIAILLLLAFGYLSVPLLRQFLSSGLPGCVCPPPHL